MWPSEGGGRGLNSANGKSNWRPHLADADRKWDRLKLAFISRSTPSTQDATASEEKGRARVGTQAPARRCLGVAGSMGALLNIWGRKHPPAPPVEGALPVLDPATLLQQSPQWIIGPSSRALPVLDPATLLQPYRPQLAAIRQLVEVRALTAKHFTPRSSRPIRASCNIS